MKRSAPLKRTPLVRKAPERPPQPAYRLTMRPNYAACTVAVPVPKGQPTKPGKHAPTRAESAWMDAITAIGCIACHIDGHPGTPGAVHHLLQGGQRIGHRFTICLCDPGHHQNGQQFGKVSRHPWKARFEAKYGTEQQLLEMTEELVSQQRVAA